MAGRGSRGPRRGRSSAAKILCAYKKCRSSKDVKNIGQAATAARSAINEAACRELHGACRLVRFCGPAHKRLCMARPESSKRGPREGLDIEQYCCLFAVLVGMGAEMFAIVSLLQVLCGERADCMCKARVRWLQHLDPNDGAPATVRIEKVNGKTQPRDVPMERAIAALLQEWLTNGLRGPGGSRWPLPGQSIVDPDAYLFPGLVLGGAGPKRNNRAYCKPITVRGYRRRLSEAAEVLERERMANSRRLEAHPFDGFPLDRLGTHSFKRSAVTLMKDACASTSLVAAIAGTTAKTLDRVYDTPTWKRKQTLVTTTFKPLSETLRTRHATGPSCPQCGKAREVSSWTCCPWCGRAY